MDMKRDLMILMALRSRRTEALKARDFVTFNALTKQISDLPMNGVPALTQKNIKLVSQLIKAAGLPPLTADEVREVR